MMNDRGKGSRSRMALVAAATMGLVVSACSDSPEEPAEPVGVDKTREELEPAQYTPDKNGRVQLPLDAYKDQMTVATGGMSAAAVECFVDVGVDADELGVQERKGEQHDRRYSVIDEAVASQYGYHPPDVEDPRDALLDAASEDQLVAASECMASLPEPSAEVVEGEQLVSDIQAEAWWATQDDQRVEDAFAAWSACMANAGHEYDHPMEANDDPRWATPEATAEEITVAKDDVACKKDVDLIATWSRVEAEQQTSRIDRYETELSEYRSALQN